MKIIKDAALAAAELAPHERFFVELWHTMTHLTSLDSYRVRCLNAHGIAKELSEELILGRLNDAELRALCDEALEILQADPVIPAHCGAAMEVLEPLLRKPCALSKTRGHQTEAKEVRRLREMQFAVRDLLVHLDSVYLCQLVEKLPKAVSDRDEDAIRRTTAALLTELVSADWPLESLWSWHLHFVSRTPGNTEAFEAKLSFMLQQLTREPVEHEVTLRLSGSDKLSTLGRSHDFALAAEVTPPPGVQASQRQLQRFFNPHPLVTFATTAVRARDALSAAMEARNRMESLLDLLRFEFEHRIVAVEDFCLVRRQTDLRTVLTRMRQPVPNPRRNVDAEGFSWLRRSVDEVSQKQCISGEARQQLEVGIRQYRFGRDSTGYRDKFLAWWLGLESLANVGDGPSIGERVARNVTAVMMHDYLRHILLDAVGALKQCRLAWSTTLGAESGCATPGDLSVDGLVKLLQSPACAQQLMGACGAHPFLAANVKRISEWLAQPSRTAALLDAHRRHLSWHLNRIYRIRCCIVHGSPVRFGLCLFSGNLEFYLREVIRFALTKLQRNNHIFDLAELYHRAAVSYERVVASLNKEGATSETIRRAIYVDVVTRE